MSIYIRYPTEGGGSGTVTDINGATGPSIDILPGTGIDVTTVGNNITITNIAPGVDPTGTPNAFAGFDNSGNLEGIPGISIDTTSGGISELIDSHPNNLSADASLNNLSFNVSPLQNSPNDNLVNTNIQLNVDSNDSGFGVGHVTTLNLGINQTHTGSSTRATNINMYNQIGNGTIPTTVGDTAYALAFGDYNDNATIDGGIQGFIFQPHVHSGALSSGAFTVNAFSDSPQIDIPVGNYVSFNSNPVIPEMKDNQNYTGLIINPTISLLNTDSNFQGIIVSGSLPQMGTNSSYEGISINTNIGGSHNAITPIQITPTISSGDGDFIGVNISPSISTTLDSVTGIQINIGSTASNQSQGVVGITSDARLQINSTTTLAAGEGFQIGSRVGNLFHIPSGSPVTGTDSININLAGDLWAEDNIAMGGVGIGYNAVGFIGSVAVNATKTVDSVTIFLPAAALPDPGVPTGGNITDFHMIRTFAPLNQGGTATISNLYGLKIDDAFGAFHSAAVNAWGIYVEDTALQNHFGGIVDMGKLQLNGSTSGVLSHQAAATTTNHTLTWPAANASGVLTNNGSGTLSWAASSSGANTALSNLASTSVNASITPASDSAINLGSASKRWAAASISQAQISDLFVNQAGTGGINRMYLSPDQPAPSGATVSLITTVHATSSPSVAKDSITLASDNDSTNNSLRTGDVALETGNKSAGTGNSGNIILQTGTSSGGARGSITLNAASISVSSTQIHNVTDPTSAQDAATKAYVDSVAGGANFIIYTHQETSGTGGGTATAGSWQTRTVNTTNVTQSWASLSSNQITLSAGTYLLEGDTKFFQTANSQSRFRNITDSSTTVLGSSDFAITALGTCASGLVGKFTIAGSKVFEVQSYPNNTSATQGYGVASGNGENEVYVQIKITKLA